MTFTRLLRRTITEWQSWRTRRRLYRQYPELRYFQEAEQAAKRRHQQVRYIRKEKSSFMLSALRGEING